MSVIKEISVFNGSSWDTRDIGANAGNITLSSNIAGSTNLNTALSNILPVSQLNINAVVVTDGNKKLTTSNLASSKLSFLSGVTSDIQTQINGKAPTSHASTTTTYGTANQDTWGHAKINNTLTVSTHQAGVGLSAYQGYLLDQNKQAKGNYVTFNNGIKSATFSYDSNSTQQTLRLYNQLPDNRKRLFLMSEGSDRHSLSFYDTTSSPSKMLWQIGSLADGKIVHIGDQSTLPSSGSSIIQNIVNINNRLGYNAASSLTPAASNISMLGFPIIDRASGTIRLFCSFYCSSGSVAAGGTIGTIANSAYRPNGISYGVGFAMGSSGTPAAGAFNVDANGRILNSNNWAAKGGLIVIEYDNPAY